MADIAFRYARALFGIGMSEGPETGKRFGELLERFAESLSGDSDIRHFLLSPRTVKRVKKEYLSSVFNSPEDRHILNFLAILVDKNRIDFVDRINDEYRRMLLASQGTREAVIESAFPLDAETIESIQAAFCKKIGAKKIVASVRIKPELIAGIRVTIGSTIYDGTTRSELDRLYDTMTM